MITNKTMNQKKLLSIQLNISIHFIIKQNELLIVFNN